MGFEIVAEQGRTQDFTITIKQADGGYLQLAETDVVRMKIGRGGTTVLDLDDKAVTTNKSGITIISRGNGSSVHCSVTVRLAQADLADMSGFYRAAVLVVDDSETAPANAIKPADVGSVVVVGTKLGGDEGLT